MLLRKAMPLTLPMALGMVLLLLLPACDPTEPIRIGFVGTLAGSYSTVGTAARDAVILAVEEQNAKGGICGRPIELLTRNAGSTSDSILAADKGLIDLGVVAVLGHVTSNMAITAVDLFNQRKVVMISPTAASIALTGVDDYFFRTRRDIKSTASTLGAFANNQAGVRTLSAVLEDSNAEYARAWFVNFRSAYESAGGRVLSVLNFNNRNPLSFKDIAAKLLVRQPAGIAVISSARDTALICQQLRLQGYKGTIFITGWAMNHSLLIHGGSAIEGAMTAQPFDPSSDNKLWQEYKKKHLARFGQVPGYEAMSSYHSALLLFEALAISFNDDIPLKQAILKIDRMEGLQGVMKFDKYGDAVAENRVIVIKGGRPVSIK